MKIEIEQEDFGTLCICALRYCRGRTTYMPSLVQGIVKPFLPMLSDKDIYVLKDDGINQRGRNLYGDELVDKPGWLKWEEAVREEQNQRRKRGIQMGINERRQALIDVFLDTQHFYTENKTLAAAAASSRSHTKLYLQDDYPMLPGIRDRRAEVAVTRSKTFAAAMQWHAAHPEDRITVLNFASAVTPGGGVLHGSSAQEESLCRCSTLYPTLDQRFLWESYYSKNRAAKNVLHTDDCIFSPDVVICKTDESIPQRMEPQDWVTVDVISCAAPNLRQDPDTFFNPEGGEPIHPTPPELIALHQQRARHIMHIAAAYHTDVLILGAFGCGAFENDPDTVAYAYSQVIREYADYFKRIEFAVYCRKYETYNFDAFSAVIR